MPKRATSNSKSGDARDLTGILPPVDHIEPVEVRIDDAWRQRCKDRWAELDVQHGKIRQEDLAEWIGVTQGTLSETLSLTLPEEKRPKTSGFCQRLSVALGVAMPPTAEGLVLMVELEDLGDKAGLAGLLMQARERVDFERGRRNKK